MKISIIIPCYNEEAGVENLSLQLQLILGGLEKKHQLELLFIDDGSKDKTLELLQQYFGNKPNVKIIKHGKNQNLGAAMRTGFAHATGDIIVTMDSDCTYNPQEIFAMLNLLDDNVDIVVASPYHPLGGIKNVPKYRLLLSKSITQAYRFLTGAEIYTFTSLFRAYKKEVVKNVEFKSNDFLATAEILINALNKGYKVKEYPTVLSVREFGESKICLAKVITSHFKFASGLLFLKVFKSKK